MRQHLAILVCFLLASGHWFRLCDEMQLKQCLQCGRLRERGY
jgi:hypothetical protein